MATSYPGGTDDFREPSFPEQTPLSSGGSQPRSHPAHHRDLGDAIEALQAHASQKTHTHDGTNTSTGGSKLDQANTHQGADTDSAPTALHHTLGSGANQAAPGNHAHQNLTVCTSETRPGSPQAGHWIWETNTSKLYVWIGTSWQVVVGGGPGLIPVCRLRQTAAQALHHNGSIIEWGQELEDNNGFWSMANKTDIFVKKPGLYAIDAAVQWDPELVPDQAHAIITQNGVETSLRQSQFMRGNLFTPGFSQTLAVSGRLRCAENDIIRLKTKHVVSGIIGTIMSWFDGTSDVKSRIDVTYVGD